MRSKHPESPAGLVTYCVATFFTSKLKKKKNRSKLLDSRRLQIGVDATCVNFGLNKREETISIEHC